MHIYMH